MSDRKQEAGSTVSRGPSTARLDRPWGGGPGLRGPGLGLRGPSLRGPGLRGPGLPPYPDQPVPQWSSPDPYLRSGTRPLARGAPRTPQEARSGCPGRPAGHTARHEDGGTGLQETHTLGTHGWTDVEGPGFL
jgi:hypothetical protein